MFDVLFFVYESYWRPDACPEAAQLGRKLAAVGFEADEIQEALQWLSGLAQSAQAQLGQDGAGQAKLTKTSGQDGAAKALSTSMRHYTEEEQACLGLEGMAFIQFLESAGVLSSSTRECVIERALACEQGELDVDDLKVIVLLVFWTLGQEPDALVMDELFPSGEDRSLH